MTGRSDSADGQCLDALSGSTARGSRTLVIAGGKTVGSAETGTKFDDAAMARNFLQEPTSIFLSADRTGGERMAPDSRKSEFPLYPWLMAQSYRFVGGEISSRDES